jgi:AcrR family transcriptional regulator
MVDLTFTLVDWNEMSVEHSVPKVKARRPYNAEGRAAQSRHTHNALLDIALARFNDHGYTATTIESIASDAGVSEATIYKTYGGKPGIVRALCLRALGGQGPIPAEQRSDALKARESDPRKVIEGWGRLTAEVAPRVAPILLLLRDAADGDPAAAALHEELDRNRLARMTDNARYLVDGGHVREGIGLAHARDVLWTYSSPELFDLLVRRRHWGLRKFSRFVVEAISNALL